MRPLGKLAAIAGALAMYSTAAFADSYVAGVRGGALTDIDFDDSLYLVGVFGGIAFADDQSFFEGNWRLQGEVSFSSDDDFGIEGRIWTLEGVAYREFASGGSVRPYVLVGFGGRFFTVETPAFEDTTSFAVVPMGVGLAIGLTDRLSLDADFRVNMIEANSDFFEFAETAEFSGALRYGF